jgi:hypothetical protein
MPFEFRFIVFKPSEALAAFVEFSKRNGRTLPKGRPVRADAHATDPVEGTLWIEDRDKPSVPVKFAHEDVLGALILFCLNRKIPLPQDSEKVAEFMKRDGAYQFALRIGVTPDIDGTGKKPGQK